DRRDVELVAVEPLDFRVDVIKAFLQLRRTAMTVEIPLAVFFVDAHPVARRIARERVDDGRRDNVVVEIDVHSCLNQPSCRTLVPPWSILPFRTSRSRQIPRACCR